MMVSKTVFDTVQGFDEEHLAVAFNDVDLCLRIGAAGYLCVYTPYAELWHHESLTRGSKMNYHEIFYMQKRWQEELVNDHYFNTHFSLSSEEFLFDPERDEVNVHTFDALEEAVGRAYRLIRPHQMEMRREMPEAIRVLAQLFAVRSDLQSTFYRVGGEVDLSSLLRWATEVGVKEDSGQELLAPYSQELRRLLEQ